ncbi:HlyD family type I secretion periplasmic adaptor subunit [Rhodoblastus sp.]|uniref:HlyD family type I secretion periplasmic adaptor subunit n=1 Tax=Rhodoblastus sp. TaxID=1962975 RepID=UPI00260B6043|nr:HlyD family type I secretion periplasmic adaptor subunit [Rhodoblastus sp.]
MSTEVSTQSVVRSFQSDVAAIREAPLPRSAMATVHVLLGFLVAFGLVLIFGKLDKVVESTNGQINLLAPAQVYQALDQSIIKSINVREGMLVRKGEVIATLDPTFATADVTQLRQQVASLNAQIVRDQAELAGKAPVFTGDDDPAQRHYNQLQQKLFLDRKAQYDAQVKSFDEQIAQTEATIAKTKNDIDRYNQRSAIAGKIETMRSSLLSSGAGSLLNELMSKDNKVEMERQVENLTNSLKEAQAQLNTYKANRDAFIQQWRATDSQDIVTAQNNRDQAVASLKKAIVHQDVVKLVAAEDSIILTVAKLSVGSVLQPGDKFITAMPVKMPIEADLDVASRDVGFIKVGDPVTLKIDAFDYAQHGTAEGKVKWISEGAFWIDENTGQPTDAYYKVGVSIDRMNFRGVPTNFRLMPGMTLHGDIKVGRRSVASYLLNAGQRGWGESMREP